MTPNQIQYLDDMWRAAWKPPEKIEAHEWCENNVLKIPYSPKGGRYSSKVSPMHVDIMRAFTANTTKLVSVVAPVQCAKTLCMELMLSWTIANDPGPTIFFEKDDPEAKDEMVTRLQPLFENTSSVNDELPPKQQRRQDFIQFLNGMPLYLLGAIPSNLQRRTIRYLYVDEWWQYKEDGIIDMALKRITQYGWAGKAFLVSQGGFEGQEGHRIHDSTNKLEQYLTCPECGESYPWTFENIGGYREGQTDKDGKPYLSWDFCKGSNDRYDMARVESSTVCMCPHCYHIWDDNESNRIKLLRNTHFQETNPGAQTGRIGFHYESNGFIPWGTLGKEYLTGKELMRSGNDTIAKQFKQQRRALAWSETADDFEISLQTSGYKTGEVWEMEAAIGQGNAIIPGPVEIELGMARLRVMCVDVQLDHFFVVVFSLSATGRARVYKYKGGRGKNGVETWQELEEIQKECDVHDSLVFVDAGHKTYTIYKECEKRGWTALMGSQKDEWIHAKRDSSGKTTRLSKPYSPNLKPVVDGRNQANAFSWSNLIIKDMVAAWIRNKHIQFPADASKAFLAQLESEHKITQKKEKGRIIKLAKPKWDQIGKRPNHYWDCVCMCMVLVVMLGLIANETLIDE
jgi:phage terminase large subunit GpA-like protein